MLIRTLIGIVMIIAGGILLFGIPDMKWCTGIACALMMGGVLVMDAHDVTTGEETPLKRKGWDDDE